MQTLARHLNIAKSAEKEKDASPKSLWLWLPRLLVGMSGVAVGSTLVLASLKLDLYPKIQWWAVFAPVTVTLSVVFLVMTAAVFFWIRFTTLVYRGDIDCDLEEVRLDVILKTAKICFLGHGYVLLLAISMGLFLAKLHFWPDLPVAYPLLPLVLLAKIYIILGIVLEQPDVDSPSFLLIGTSVLSQSIMLILKLDHLHKSKNLPWVTVFIPCWVTYVILLGYSALCAAWAAVPVPDAAPETTPETQKSPIRQILSLQSHRCSASPHLQCYKASGIACFAVGFGVSQVFLCLRLDGHYKEAWVSTALPAFLGWILFVAFVFGQVSEYFEEVATLLFDTFSLSSSSDGYDSSDVEEDRQPLLRPKRGVTTEVD